MFLVLFIFWIILNGKIGVECSIVGLAVTALLFRMSCRHLNYTLKRDLRMLKQLPRTCVYLLQLIRDMIVSTLRVISYVYSAKYVPEPTIVEFDGKFSTNIGMTMMANYITLTPGTITVRVENNHFVVHCLDEEFAPDPEGPMAEIILGMERE